MTRILQNDEISQTKFLMTATTTDYGQANWADKFRGIWGI